MNILPNKYIKPQNSMLGMGSEILVVLSHKQSTISDLWNILSAEKEKWTFEKLTHTLDLLFLLNIIHYEDGLLCLKGDNHD